MTSLCEKCALALYPSIELVEERVVYNTEDRRFAVYKTDRDTHMREAMNEVGCTIYT